MKGQTFHFLFEICVIFIIFIEYNDCYVIVPDKDEDKANVTSKKVGKVHQHNDIKLKKSILDIEAEQGSFKQRNEQTKNSEHVDKTNNDEELEKLTNLITNICEEKYVLCHGREDEMNYFKETSPCMACSCNPILCQIAENCCPDVEPQSMDEEEVVLPVCMPMYDIIPKLRVEYKQKNHLKITNDLARSQKLQRGRIFDKSLHMTSDINENTLNKIEIPAKNNLFTKQASTPKNQNAIYGTSQQSSSTETSNYELNETAKESEENGGTDDAETEHENKDVHKNIVNCKIREHYQVQINNSQTQCKDSNQPQTKGFSSDVVASNRDIEKTFISMNGNDVVQNGAKPELEFLKFLVMNRCPKDFLNDTDIVELCEKTNSTELMDYVPMYQYTNHLLYKNKWCAKCHKADWEQAWMLLTDCMHMYEHYNLPSDLEGFLNLYKNCSGYFVPPKGNIRTFQTCSVKPSEGTKLVIVDKCNITGHWENNDKLISELCKRRTYLPLYQDTSEKSRIAYKNIFCFTCNARKNSRATVYGKKIMENHPESMLGENKIYMNVNIEKEIKFINYDTDLEDITCPSNYIPDFYNKGCILFKCPIYQTVIANFCINKDSYTTGLVLTAILSVTFQDGPVIFEHDDAEISKYGQNLNSVIDKKLLFTKNGCKIVFVRIVANYTNINTKMVNKMYVKYKIANTETCSVQTIVSTLEIVSTNIKTTIAYENKTLTGPFHGVTIISKTISIGLEFGSLYNMQISKTLISIPVSYEYELLETFNCPSVFLNMSYYKRLVEIKAFLPLSPDNLDTKYTQSTGLVPICYTMYTSQLYSSQYKQISVTQDSSINKLGFLSTLISMVSIIMVLITYFLFPELRYVPGKLFMMLCFNLFIAQGLFTFGIGMGEDNGWCQFIGILIHLFWLATIFSMNSNLILMFGNLQRPLDASSRATIYSRSNWRVCKYTIYSYSVSILCILINIILSVVMFDDDHYGYGGKLCYIKIPIMRLITFVIPLIIVLIANFGMFTLIIYNISQTMYKHYCFLFRASIQMILKLSTITGVFWLFGFLYEATGISLFEYIFVILNAGQGFFLMTSFMINKKVLQLYKDKVQMYCKKREDTTESYI